MDGRHISIESMREWMKPFNPVIEQIEDGLRDEGRRDALRWMLIHLCARRGWRLTKKQEEMIASCHELEILARWLDQAIDAASAPKALR